MKSIEEKHEYLKTTTLFGKIYEWIRKKEKQKKLFFFLKKLIN